MARQTRQGPSFNDLKAAIRRGDIPRLLVLAGEETFLIENIAATLTEVLIAPGAADLDRVLLTGAGRGGQISLEQIRSEVMTPPFLSTRKLVIVRASNWFVAGAATTDGLVALIQALPDSVCLLFMEEKIDRRLKKLVQAIESQGLLALFDRAQPRVLQQWVEGLCRQQGLTIDPAAAASLIDRCEGSMQVLDQELKKLFLTCQATACTHIDLDLIEAVSLPDLHGTIFHMTDALSAGRVSDALRLTDTLIAQKQPVQLILFMLTRHFRQLICAADLKAKEAIGSRLKLPPFVAARLASQAAGLPIERLESLYALCFETDVAIKSGQIGDRLGLETLLIDCSRSLTR